jgi:hypothetical protein
MVDRDDLPVQPVLQSERCSMSEDFLADYVDTGSRFTVVFPDGSSHEAIVLGTFKGGSAQVDLVNKWSLSSVESALQRQALEAASDADG